MEITNCDLCGSTNYTIIATQTDLIHKSTKEHFSIVECKDCGLNFTNPRPSLDEIGVFYTESYTFHHMGGVKSFIKTSILGKLIKFIANSALAYVFFFIPSISNLLGSQVKPKIQDPVIKYIKDKKIESFLDIGCGSGVNPHFWGTGSSLVKCNKIIKVYGCEPNKSSRHFLNENGIFCWSNIEEIEKDRKFDLIRMNWSLEHVHAPSKYFEFINNHLSEDGRAIIAVPNYKGLIYRLSKSCVELPIHLYHFSEDSLKKYSNKYNLELTSSITFSYPSMFSFSYDVGLLPDKFSFKKGIFFSKKFQNILNIFDKFGLGNDIVVTIRKKSINTE
jgi:SAM-dependent methyltransferase